MKDFSRAIAKSKLKKEENIRELFKMSLRANLPTEVHSYIDSVLKDLMLIFKEIK